MPPPVDLSDRRTIDVAIWLLLIGLFALFGASAKLLYYWHPTPWTRTIGSLMVSVFAAWLVGLLAWRFLESSPGFLFVLTGAAAWLGGEIIDRITRRLSTYMTALLPPELPSNGDKLP